jgi:hypothetical protein
MGHRTGTKREPDVWRLVGRRQGVRAREGLTLFLGLTKACRRQLTASTPLPAAPDARR